MRETAVEKWIDRCKEFKASHANLKTIPTASTIEVARSLLDMEACDELLVRLGDHDTNIHEFFFCLVLFGEGDIESKLAQIFNILDHSKRGWISTQCLRIHVALVTCGLDRLLYIPRPALSEINEVITDEKDGYWTLENVEKRLLGHEKSHGYIELISNPLVLESVLEELDTLWEDYIVEIHEDRKQRSTIEWHVTTMEIQEQSRPQAVEIGFDFEIQHHDAVAILRKVCPWLPAEILPEILSHVITRCEKKGVDYYKGGIANLKMKPTQHSFLRSIRSDDLNLIVAAALAFSSLARDPLEECVDSRHFFTLQSILLELSSSFRGLDIGYHLPELSKCVSVDGLRFVQAVGCWALTQERVQFYTKTIQAFQRHERHEVLKRNTCELALRQWVFIFSKNIVVNNWLMFTRFR